MEANTASIPFDLLSGFTISYDNRRPRAADKGDLADVPLYAYAEKDISHSYEIDLSEIQYRLHLGLRYKAKGDRTLDPPNGAELGYISSLVSSSLQQHNIGDGFIRSIPQQVFQSFYTTTVPSGPEFLEIVLQLLKEQGAGALHRCLLDGKFPIHILRSVVDHFNGAKVLPAHVSLLVNACSNLLATGNVNLFLLESARTLYFKNNGASTGPFSPYHKWILHENHEAHGLVSTTHKIMSTKSLDEFYRVEASVNKFYAQKLFDYVFGSLSNPFLGSLTLSTIGGCMYTFHKPKFDNSLAIFSVTNGLRNGVLSDPLDQQPIYSYRKQILSSLYVSPEEASGNVVSKSRMDQDYGIISNSNLYAHSGRVFVIEHIEPFPLSVCLPGMAYRLGIFYSTPENMKSFGKMHTIQSIINTYYTGDPSAYTGSYCFTSMDTTSDQVCGFPEDSDGADAVRQISPSVAAPESQNLHMTDTSPHSSTAFEEAQRKANFYLFPPISQNQLLEMDSTDQNMPFIHPVTKTTISKTTLTVAPHLIGPHGYAQCCFYGQRCRFLLVKDRTHIVTQKSTIQYAVSSAPAGASTLQLRSTNWVLRELPTVCLAGQFFPAPTFTVQHSKSGAKDLQKMKDNTKKEQVDGTLNTTNDPGNHSAEPARKQAPRSKAQSQDTISNASDPSQSYTTVPRTPFDDDQSLLTTGQKPSLATTATDTNKQSLAEKMSIGDNVYFVLGPENVKRIIKHRIGYFITRFNIEGDLQKTGTQEKSSLQAAILTRYKDLLGIFAAESFFKDMADSAKGDKSDKNDEFCTGLVSETHIFYILLLENFLSSGAFVDRFLTKSRADYYLMQAAKMTAEKSDAKLFLIDRFLGWSQMALCLLTNFRVSYMHKIRENNEFQTYSYVDENSYQSFGATSLRFGCFTSLLSKFGEKVENSPKHDLPFKNRLHIFPFSLREDQSRPLLEGIYSVITDQPVNSQILYPYKKLHASAFPKIGLFTRPFINRDKNQKRSKSKQGGLEAEKEDDIEQEIFQSMNKVFELDKRPDIHCTNCNAALLPKTRQRASAPDDLRVHIEQFGLCASEIEFCINTPVHILRRLPLDKFNVVNTGFPSKILEEHRYQDVRVSGSSSSHVEYLPTHIRRAFKEHLHPVNVVLSMRDAECSKDSQSLIAKSNLDRSDKSNMLWSGYMQKIIEIIDDTGIRDILTTDQHNIIHVHALRAMDNKNQEKLAAARYKLKRASLFLSGKTVLPTHNLGSDFMTYRGCPFLSKKVLKDAGEDRVEKIISGYANAITEHVFPDSISGTINSQAFPDERMISSFNNYANYSSITMKPREIFSCLGNDVDHGVQTNSYDPLCQEGFTDAVYPFHIFYPVKQARAALSDEGIKGLVKSCWQRWTDDEHMAMCNISRIIRVIKNRSTLFSLRVSNPRGGLTMRDKCLVLDSSAQAKTLKSKAGMAGRSRQRGKMEKDNEISSQANDLPQLDGSLSVRDKMLKGTRARVAGSEDGVSAKGKEIYYVDSIDMNDYTVYDQMKEYWDPRKCLFGITRLFEQLTSRSTLIYGVTRDYQDRIVDVSIYPYEQAEDLDDKFFMSKSGDEILHCSSIIADMSIVSDYTRGNMNLALANNLKKMYKDNVPMFVISEKDSIKANRERIKKISGDPASTEEKQIEMNLSLVRESRIAIRTIYIDMYSYPGFSLDTMHYGILAISNTQQKPLYRHRTVTISKLPPRDALNVSFFNSAITHISTIYTDCGAKVRGVVTKNIFSLSQDKLSSYMFELDRCSEEYWPTAPHTHCLLICENKLAEEKWGSDQKPSQTTRDKIFYTMAVKNKAEMISNGTLQQNTFETTIDFPSEIVDVLRFSQEMRDTAGKRLKSFLDEISALKSPSDSTEGLTYWFNMKCLIDTKNYEIYTKFISTPVFMKDIEAHVSKPRVRECVFKCFIDIIQDMHKMVLNALQYNLTEPIHADGMLSEINTEEDLNNFLKLDRARNAVVLWYVTELMRRLRQFYRINSQAFALLGVSWIRYNFYDSVSGSQPTPGKLKAMILGSYYHITRYYIRPYDALLKDDYVRLGRKQQKMCRRQLDAKLSISKHI